MIALTFDDGPGPYTAQLLDILDQHGAKATFFLIGSAGETDQPVGEPAPALADEAAEQDQVAAPLSTQTAEEPEQQEAAADKQP